jgi:segregation and condensation protein B
MENELNLESKIESLLFYKGEPVSFKEISGLLGVSHEEIKAALNDLQNSLSSRGITLILGENEVMLGTNKQMSEFFENLRKEELNKELSRASLETLSIVLYKGKVLRSEIDYIRGVNSTYILRNLAVRGLVDKISDTKDSRASFYTPSLELLASLGISSINELPDYENVLKTLESKILDKKEDETNIS